MSISRINLIINILRTNRYPASSEELLSYLNEEGHSISLRTLYRDLNKIEEDFGQTITKNKIDLHGKKVTGYKNRRTGFMRL